MKYLRMVRMLLRIPLFSPQPMDQDELEHEYFKSPSCWSIGCRFRFVPDWTVILLQLTIELDYEWITGPKKNNFWAIGNHSKIDIRNKHFFVITFLFLIKRKLYRLYILILTRKNLFFCLYIWLFVLNRPQTTGQNW